MTNKTAITQLIEWFESKAVSNIAGRTILDVKTSELNAKFRDCLEIEKQQIIEAAKWLPKPFKTIEFLPELGEEYYNQTYNDDNAARP